MEKVLTGVRGVRGGKKVLMGGLRVWFWGRLGEGIKLHARGIVWGDG